MTKAASILIAPMIALRTLPEQDRAVIRRFLFDLIRGLDAKHDKRWRRFWTRIIKAEPGEVVQLQDQADRSNKFHRRHMAIEQRLFDSQERWTNIDRFRDWLKTGAGFGHYELVGARMKFIPSSTSYEQCSDAEMREFHENLMVFLHAPYAQRRLWPHLKSGQRQDMLETVIQGPSQEGEQ
jgi:hypothetical protein